jgi:6-phosphogluconolactonase/glucosamine-6-phosphate isomerase/deaminase
MWLVTGAGKADMLARLMAGDPDVPAGRVRSARAIVFADRDAAAALPAC